LTPLATAWLTKLLFDLLAQALQSGDGRLAAPIVLILVVQVLVALFSYSLGLANTYFRAELGRKLTLHVQQTVYRQINRFAGLRYFEDPAFHDTVSLGLRGAGQGPTQTVQNFSNLLRSLAVLVSFIGVLLLFNLLLALAVIVAVLPQLYSQTQIGRQRFRLAVANTFRQRQMSYYGSLLSNEHYVKEVRLFGLADWLLKGFLRIATAYQERQRQQELREIKWQLPVELLARLAAGGAFIFIALQVLAGRLTIGDVTLYMSAVSSVQANLAGIIFALAGIDIRRFDPADLRQQMGVIFQDFARYNLTLRENIGLGDVAHLDDEARIMRAGRQAGLADVIQKLPRGYDTVLKHHQRLELVYLPTYSPHLNHIERLWRVMRSKVTRNRFYESLDAVSKAAVHWLNTLPFAQFCSLMGVDKCELAIVHKPFSY
jgi:ABC-type multidrug transport system fused ATPase/permease subunit